ncbi:MAG: ParB/RepB/Spo0J family partition protein [Dehalococcoidia bacterium]
MARKSGLGRGLSALIPEAPVERERVDAPKIPATEVETSRIVPNPQQPRLRINAEELEELTASVRVHGIIQPLLVAEMPAEDGPVYQLIAGERRWRAAQAAGLERVPVTIRQSTPQELLELAIIENVQRADLDPLEEALAYQRLADDFGLTQREIADRVGRSRVAVTNIMRLVDLSEELRASLARGEITEGHARALLGLADELQRRQAWRRVIDEGLNVRETERMVRVWNAPPEAAPAATEADADTDAMADMLRRTLGTKVTLRRGRGGTGSVTLHFFSDEELDGLLDRLLGQDRYDG